MPATAAIEPAVLDDPVELARFTRWTGAPGGARRAESALRIVGMHCAACAGLVEDALAGVAGVESARVSPASQRASVRWDPARTSASALVAAVHAAGYGAEPDTTAGARAERRREGRRALWRLFVAAFCSMQVMMLAAPSYVAEPGELAGDLGRLLRVASWLMTLPVMAFSAAPFFAGAWRSLRARRVGMDVPVALGIAVAFVAGTGATFDPGGVFGDEVWFDSLTMFVAFLLGGRWLEMRARHRAAEALEASVEGLALPAWRLGPDGAAEAVAPDRLAAGDLVRVPAGAAFPADGRVAEGTTHADEALLTGESRPVRKASGDAVVAGSLNVGAPVVVVVERVGLDTRQQAIAALVRDAQSQRPALARVADRWATPFLDVVLLLAAAAGVGWSFVDPGRALAVAVAVLVVTCPCALSLAAPSAVLAAVGALARRGVLAVRLDALEALAGVHRLFVDKTGTLTEPRPALAAVERLAADDARGDEALLAAAAALAAWSTHPLAAAVASAGTGAPAPAWRDVVERPGQGLAAFDADGAEWRLGSAAWLGVEGAPDDGATAAWFGRPRRPSARLVFEERLRPDVRAAIASLRAQGVAVTLLSGDAPARAAALAEALGLDGCFGGATPEAKLAALQDAQRRGERVAMVGDGVNDAPVLAAADVSFAMGEGALLARRHADAVVVSNRLADVAAAVGLSRRMLGVVRQNLAWAAAYNAVCVPLALAGWLPPWAAGLGMAASSLGVVANSLRLARSPKD